MSGQGRDPPYRAGRRCCRAHRFAQLDLNRFKDRNHIALNSEISDECAEPDVERHAINAGENRPFARQAGRNRLGDHTACLAITHTLPANRARMKSGIFVLTSGIRSFLMTLLFQHYA